MTTNIVMLVHDRPKLTWQALRSLAANTPEDAYNLTLIDDGSEPELGETLREIASKSTHVALLTIAKSKGITGQARNLGVYWAEKYWGRGDFLYLTDNDMYFTPDWLEKLAEMFIDVSNDYRMHSKITMVPIEGGKYKAGQEFKIGEPYILDGAAIYYPFVLGGWNHPFLQPLLDQNWPIGWHDAVAGASQLMRWETWDKYSPLDAHAVGVGKSEDWKFCQDIIKGGGTVASIYPRVVFNCGITNSLGQPSPGACQMLAELHEAKLAYTDLYWE